jgi:hypothetical protein
VEFTPQQLDLEVNGEIEQASYFSQQGVRPSEEPWSFDEWQRKDERLSVVTASFGWSSMESTQRKRPIVTGMMSSKQH